MNTKQIRRYRSPGRINLIGEHTDYNSGWVLPGAIDMTLIFEIQDSSDDLLHFYSEHFDEEDTCDLSGQGFQKRWSVFFGQVIQLLCAKGYFLEPFSCSFGGTLPIGAGMSSSSALTCGLIYAVNDYFNLGISTLDMMYMASEAELGSGLNGGKMDQYSILFGEENAVLLLDCESYTHQSIKVDLGDYTIVLFDTAVTHELLDSGYNDRHADCRRGLRQLQQMFPELKTLRDIEWRHLYEASHLMDRIAERRIHYVLEENVRVMDVVDALKAHELRCVGELMYRSHSGLRHEYEVSCKELDFIVDWTYSRPEILGARMMGGGFGGCVIAIADRSLLDDSFDALNRAYQDRFGMEASMYKVSLSQGVCRIE